ncbi:MAG: P1 family peptidase [Gemmatimonadota bacterium]|nr:P1 family peptidase [Gemmatimonadota bacterium]
MDPHKNLLRSILTLLGLALCAGAADAQRPRARELGIRIGTLEPGPHNAITDVTGVRVGHVTLISGEGELEVGNGPVRTGVTAVVPHADDVYLNQVFASAVALNGNGEMTGMEWINERGLLEVPVVVTNTLSVGEGYSGVVAYMLQKNPGRVPLPVVAECYDGGLNDIAGRHVKEEHVIRAIESAAGGQVSEGSVGAGTGMRAYGFKAGIGTASRVLDSAQGAYTLGVLVVANCGRRPNLVIDGVPVGRHLPLAPRKPTRDGSIVITIATDAPLIPVQLRRLCKRSALGVSRTGTFSRTSSGDLALAFSTSRRIPRDAAMVDTVHTLRDRSLNPLLQATVEATEEAIVNALCAAETMTGRDNRTMPGIPVDRLVKIMKQHNRIE